MLRLVLAVALAVALLAVATPALEDARAARTERLTERELDRFETAALSLAREEEPGARRTLNISLPGESPTAARLAFVALGGLPDEAPAVDTPRRDALAYQVAGGRRHVRSVEVDVRVASESDSIFESDPRALVLRGGERYRLSLQLVRLGDLPTVVVAAETI